METKIESEAYCFIPPHVRAEISELVTWLLTGVKRLGDLNTEGEYTLDLTVGYSPATQQWGYQTGDNSFTGGAYCHPIWGVTTITDGCSVDTILSEIFGEIEEQLEYYSSL
jgi:hypothetical protein